MLIEHGKEKCNVWRIRYHGVACSDTGGDVHGTSELYRGYDVGIRHHSGDVHDSKRGTLPTDRE